MDNIAHRIIMKLGGHENVACLLGVDVSQVYRWTYPKDKGGTNGLIPTRHLLPILACAKKIGADLSPEDFFNTNIKKPKRKTK